MEKQQIIGKLIDRSLSIALLLLAAWLLWDKAEKVETQMHDYMRGDREKMTLAIQESAQATRESTQAMRDCARAIDRSSLIIDQLNDKR